jgi:hypothetical protein
MDRVANPNPFTIWNIIYKLMKLNGVFFPSTAAQYVTLLDFSLGTHMVPQKRQN